MIPQMPARAISSATISFGLVSIPVKLFTTTESGNSISFRMLHTCGTRIKQQNYCPKDEKVVLTGHLGQVMQESARAARSHLWSTADAVGIDRSTIEENGVHIHVPAGAVPKDGPSAGVTMATALYSAYTEKPVARDMAMTGELTLSGLVLPVGGIKEKLLAAHRAGKHTVILPAENEADLIKLPDSVRGDLDVVLVRTIEEVFAAAF